MLVNENYRVPDDKKVLFSPKTEALYLAIALIS